MTELNPFETRQQTWASKIRPDLFDPLTKAIFEDGVLGENAVTDRLQGEGKNDD